MINFFHNRQKKGNEREKESFIVSVRWRNTYVFMICIVMPSVFLLHWIVNSFLLFCFRKGNLCSDKCQSWWSRSQEGSYQSWGRRSHSCRIGYCKQIHLIKVVWFEEEKFSFQDLKKLCWGGTDKTISNVWSKQGLVFKPELKLFAYGLKLPKNETKNCLQNWSKSQFKISRRVIKSSNYRQVRPSLKNWGKLWNVRKMNYLLQRV